MSKITVAALQLALGSADEQDNIAAVAEQAAGDGMIMAGQTTSSVAVQVDFALIPK